MGDSMFHDVKLNPEDYFKVRYIVEDYPGLLTKGRIYNAAYIQDKNDTDGRIVAPKKFDVIDETEEMFYYDNDCFEIVKDE